MRSSRQSHARREFASLSLLELETRDVPTFLGNQLFPVDNPWNQDVSSAPVAANSAAIIAAIVNRHGGTAPRIHADFGNPATDGALYGIPINVATSATTKVSVLIPSAGYADESDLVKVPIPAGAVLEGDGPTGPSDPSNPGARGDSHLLVYDRDANILYELVSAARPNETSYPYGGSKATGSWGAYGIAMWDLNTNDFRTVGFTSADAAGLPILTGLVRPDEANPPSSGGVGVIDHAIRVTLQQITDSFVFPAEHLTTGYDDPVNLPRMGERFRLSASFQIPTGWSPEAKAIAQAMKTYGLIVADNGSDMYFQGVPSTSWNMANVLQVQSIRASDFEVVDLTPVVTGLSTHSGAAAGGTNVTITGKNFSGAAGRLHVFFGTTEATSYTIVSDTKIVVTAPNHSAGNVDVRVQSGENETDKDGNTVFFGYGTSANTSADAFTFTGAGGGSPPPPPGPTSPPPAPPAPPASQTPVVNLFATGTNGGTSGTVIAYNADGSIRFVANPFGAGYVGAVKIAVGDVDADGVADVVALSDLDQVVIYSGRDQSILASYSLPVLPGGLNVAVGDVNGDGTADVIFGTAAGFNAVVVFSGATQNQLAAFLPFSEFSLPGLAQTGVTLAAGDLDGDGKAEILVGTASRYGFIAVYSGQGQLLTVLAPLALAPIGGVTVAAGDVNGDGRAEIILGLRALPVVAVFDGSTQALLNAAVVYSGQGSGVTVATVDRNGDRKAEILTGAIGSGVPSQIEFFDGQTLKVLNSFFADVPSPGGIWVG